MSRSWQVGGHPSQAPIPVHMARSFPTGSPPLAVDAELQLNAGGRMADLRGKKGPRECCFCAIGSLWFAPIMGKLGLKSAQELIELRFCSARWALAGPLTQTACR